MSIRVLALAFSLSIGCAVGPPVDGAGGAIEPGGSASPSSAGSSSASRCAVAANGDITCTHQAITLDQRAVLWQTPIGPPPPSGWPLVVVYQGSLMSPSGSGVITLSSDGMWAARASDAASYGIFAANVLSELHTQTGVIRALLDGGYAVITPTADGGGFAWDTNLPPWLFNWPPAPDNTFLDHLFAAVDGGAFGPIDAKRWYATGVSSGGYMTSRMAVSYAGRFRALAIAAGSYATCGGPSCLVPSILPTDHPPTMFLHGGLDAFVPIATMYAYLDILKASGHEATAVVDPFASHGWISSSPAQIKSWFDAH